MNRLVLTLLVAVTSCAPPPSADAGFVAGPAGVQARVGMLVMAHGGSTEWNRQVTQAVDPLQDMAPVVVAFGMANRHSLETGLDSLRRQGVTHVAVVRLFLSGASFLDQTRYYLGLSDTPPEHFLLMGPGSTAPSARTPIDHELVVATHVDGLLGSEEARTILAKRALELSRSAAEESVLFIAHGMGDDADNTDVLDVMRPAAERLDALGFARADVATLREDWEDDRAVAEEEIRRFVSAEMHAGRRVLVVPARLSGFGPYAEVLTGLEYEQGRGLLPHDEIEKWLRSTATRVACSAGWGPALGPCGTAVVRPSTTDTDGIPRTPRIEASSRRTPSDRAR